MFAYLFFKKFPSYSALLGPCLIKEIWPLHIWLSKWKVKIYQKLLWKLNKVLFTQVRCNEFGSHVFQSWILSFVKKYLNHIFQTCAFRNRHNSSQPWFWVAMKPKSWLSWVVSISKGTCLENVIEVLFYNELNPWEKKPLSSQSIQIIFAYKFIRQDKVCDINILNSTYSLIRSCLLIHNLKIIQPIHLFSPTPQLRSLEYFLFNVY